MTIEPTLEANNFVLNNETRSTAYAFLLLNPSYNIEDSDSPLSTTISQMGLNCIKDKDPVTEIVLSSHVYNSFLGCNELIMALEPVTRIRDMMAGKVGSLYGAVVYTEAYMHPTEQMMGPKEILFHTQSDKWFRVYTKTVSSSNI